MITDVFVVYNDKSQVKRVEDANITSPAFHFINALSKHGQKEAWALKSHWAAKLDPFAIVMNENKAIKAFYSETGEDVINSLIKFLKEDEQNSNYR